MAFVFLVFEIFGCSQKILAQKQQFDKMVTEVEQLIRTGEKDGNRKT
jgi:hypothetical protein